MNLKWWQSYISLASAWQFKMSGRLFGKQDQCSLHLRLIMQCATNLQHIGVGAGKFLRVQNIFGRVSPNLPEKFLCKFCLQELLCFSADVGPHFCPDFQGFCKNQNFWGYACTPAFYTTAPTRVLNFTLAPQKRFVLLTSLEQLLCILTSWTFIETNKIII